jgi:hypothetical protein
MLAGAQAAPRLCVAALANDIGISPAYAFEQGYFKKHRPQRHTL